MNAVGWLWLAFLGLWKTPDLIEGRTPDSEDIKLSLLLYLGIALLIFGPSTGSGSPVARPYLYTIVGLFIVAAFARFELGENFYKRLFTVDTGLYAAVEHPIYTAVGLAAIVTAIAYGTPQAYLGAGAAVTALVLKAKEENRD